MSSSSIDATNPDITPELDDFPILTSVALRSELQQVQEERRERPETAAVKTIKIDSLQTRQWSSINNNTDTGTYTGGRKTEGNQQLVNTAFNEVLAPRTFRMDHNLPDLDAVLQRTVMPASSPTEVINNSKFKIFIT